MRSFALMPHLEGSEAQLSPLTTDRVLQVPSAFPGRRRHVAKSRRRISGCQRGWDAQSNRHPVPARLKLTEKHILHRPKS